MGILASSTSSLPLQGRVAIITGASRGIGREIALTLASAGADIVVAAKSTTEKPNLPGTIYSVAQEVRERGSRALAVKCDVRKEEDVRNMVKGAVEAFSRVDYLICNSGALWWRNVEDTPMDRYDLVHEVNVRGSFMCTRECLKVMKKQKFGRIIVMSPPIELRWLTGHVAYCISKYGMTMLAMGLAKEVEEHDIGINALWPATLIESFATKNFRIGDEKQWRKATILADCVLKMLQEPANKLSGQALIDEEYLRSRGETNLKKYRCVESVEPKKTWPPREVEFWKPPAGAKVPPGVTRVRSRM